MSPLRLTEPLCEHRYTIHYKATCFRPAPRGVHVLTSTLFIMRHNVFALAAVTCIFFTVAHSTQPELSLAVRAGAVLAPGEPDAAAPPEGAVVPQFFDIWKGAAFGELQRRGRRRARGRRQRHHRRE